MTKPTKKYTPKIVRMTEDWQENFKRFSLRPGFQIALSKAMLEFICAISDDVAWDRAYFPGIVVPDNWFSTAGSLIKRGLIVRKSQEQLGREHAKRREAKDHEWGNHWELTPAGKKVVELVKMAGMFVTADAAIRKNTKKA